MAIRDLLISPEQRILMQIMQAQRCQGVIDLLEDMAPDLLRINASAAETAGLMVLRLRAQMPYPL